MPGEVYDFCLESGRVASRILRNRLSRVVVPAHLRLEDRMALSAAQSLSLVRRFVAATLLIHGVARIAHGGVFGFGDFLGQQGIPLGQVVAWAISIFEVLGGISLWLGRFVRPVAWLFAGQLAAGIALVHAREGWFVVGLGRNGMEFSVLLVGCLVAVALAQGPARK